jgi:hypothetical protein
MGFTTGRTTAQMAAVLVTAGALPDQALCALHTGAWKKNQPIMLWNVLVQCTAGWNDAADATWEYDITPVTTNTSQTIAQTAAALVTAGARPEQATHALHSLGWQPNRPTTLWGVFVECTTGWNGVAPVYEYTTSPS